MMFDYDPSDNPPIFTAPAESLYEYFDENPELGTLPQETRDLKVCSTCIVLCVSCWLSRCTLL